MERLERWASPALVAAALGVLGAIAVAHPGLRFVDFLSFSNRARRLLDGQDWLNGLYPVGYPALLLGLKGLFGDVLIAGKALSLVAGGLAMGAAAALVGPGGAAWLLALPGFLDWGSTEGTDLLAAALGIAALAAAARGRPGLAGALAGLGCLTRYTGVAVLPAVLWLSPARGRTFGFFVAFTAPHWAVALGTGRSPLPSQEGNLAIGGSAGWADALRQWPAGALRAGRFALVGWVPWLGAAGILAGLVRRERAAAALLAWAILHIAGVGLAFSNARLVLPATLALGSGVGWLLPTRARILAAVPALAVMAAGMGTARLPDPGEASLTAISTAMADLPGPWLTTNPSFYLSQGGWLDTGALVRNLGGDPRRLDPTTLRQQGEARGFAGVVVDTGRVRATYPGLAPLLGTSLPPGFTELRSAPGWRALIWSGAPFSSSGAGIASPQGGTR